MKPVALVMGAGLVAAIATVAAVFYVGNALVTGAAVILELFSRSL